MDIRNKCMTRDIKTNGKRKKKKNTYISGECQEVCSGRGDSEVVVEFLFK